jgi:uncharacterized tellurite resistance protein B-like protein
MRSYPLNSPQAAGRILALVLLADGDVSSRELQTIERLGSLDALGLDAEQLSELIQHLCDDLHTGLCMTGSLLSALDEATLTALLREVDEPRLQAAVLQMAREAASAEGHLADGEVAVLGAAERQWGCTAANGAAPAGLAA